jgi:hypothetical protein
VSRQTRATVDFETTGSSKVSQSVASTSRTESPRRNEQMTSDSSACVRATLLPRTFDSKPSALASRTRGRSSSTAPLVVFTMRALVAVAVGERLSGTLVASPPEELGDLVLERLLEDQRGADAADGLDRVGLSLDAVEHLVELTAESL